MINLLDYKIENQFNAVFKEKTNKEIVLFCVGNNKIWYDSFGPKFADMAREQGFKCFVYGGCKFSIVPDNLLDYMDFVEHKHPSALVIVVDNCLDVSRQQKFDIEIKKTSVVPAGLVNKKSFGNISILLKTTFSLDYVCYFKFQQIVIQKLIKKLQTYIDKTQKKSILMA